jgi:mono/diheme cytochrome c family protein
MRHLMMWIVTIGLTFGCTQKTGDGSSDNDEWGDDEWGDDDSECTLEYENACGELALQLCYCPEGGNPIESTVSYQDALGWAQVAGTSNPVYESTCNELLTRLADAGGCAEADADTDADGGTIFAANCASCHGSNGVGASAPDLTVTIPPLSDDDLMDIIQNGTGSMPAPSLSTEEEDLVFFYLRDTFGEFGGPDGAVRCDSLKYVELLED